MVQHQVSEPFYNLQIVLYLLGNKLGINTLGVCSPNLDVTSAEIGTTLDEIRNSAKQLFSSGYIVMKKYNNIVYFIIPEHFNTIPKSDSSVLRVQKAIQELPKGLQDDLAELGISSDRKVVTFDAPSVEEVRSYILSQGYNVNAATVVDFYESKGKTYNKEGRWVNSKGKEVKDWKATLRQVWFKEERKLKAVVGAPKGFEYFHVVLGGEMIFPDKWINGLPKSKDFAKDAEMKKQFNLKNK